MNTALDQLIALQSTSGAGSGIQRESPIRTIIRQNREAGVEPLQRTEIPTMLVVWLLVAAIVLGITAWWINRRATRAVSAEASAERKLARGLRLGRAARNLLPELERATGIPTLALLASRSALRRAMEMPEAGNLSGKPGWQRLEALVASASESMEYVKHTDSV
ncbi:MAG: hypothetical protein Q9O74_02010 [Planctomycetota bacterium]|nr:hypothetical protein [Planctomycetota bacterium]